MSTIDERVAQLQANAGCTWEQKLFTASNEDWESAAIADLAFDGQVYTIDLRRAPFAGNEELKRAAQEARVVQGRLQRALLDAVAKANE